MIENYHKGKKEGKEIEYYANGKKRREGNYSDGMLNGLSFNTTRMGILRLFQPTKMIYLAGMPIRFTRMVILRP
jgi:hypothetical protein